MACRAGPQDSHGQTHLAPCRILNQPALPKTDRGDLRLGEEAGRPCQNYVTRKTKGRSRFHFYRHRLQSDPDTETAEQRPHEKWINDRSRPIKHPNAYTDPSQNEHKQPKIKTLRNLRLFQQPARANLSWQTRANIEAFATLVPCFQTKFDKSCNARGI